MSVLADLRPAEREQVIRMETTTITPQPTSVECGFTGWSRDVAEAVREALRGTAWRAEARSPYWPHPENETRAELIISVKIDKGWTRMLHTHTVPAYTARDMFTLTVDGRSVRYGLHRGDIPHMPAVIARTVWRHVNGHQFGECAALTCTEPPTVASFRGTLCHEHAERYAEHGRW